MFLPTDSFLSACKPVQTITAPAFEPPEVWASPDGNFSLKLPSKNYPIRIIVEPETDQIFLPLWSAFHESSELLEYLVEIRREIYPIYWFLIFGTNETLFNFAHLEYLVESDVCPQNIKDLAWREIDRRNRRISCRPNPDHKKYTYTYLMYDERTRLHKIGQSDTPTYRERTLQSDNPLIILCNAWVTSRQEEKILHQIFESKRVRGEWFNLSMEEVDSIYWRFNGRMDWHG